MIEDDTFLLSCIKILRQLLLVTLEMATHNCPLLKTGVGKYNPTVSSDWPWDLLIVIALETIIGNFLLINLNGHGDSKCDIDIRGM